MIRLDQARMGYSGNPVTAKRGSGSLSVGSLSVLQTSTSRDVYFQGKTNPSGLMKGLMAAAALVLPSACTIFPSQSQPTAESRPYGASIQNPTEAILPGGCLTQSEITVPGKTSSFQNFENAINRVSSLYPTMGLEQIPIAIQHLAPSVPCIQVVFEKPTAEKDLPRKMGSTGSGIIVDDRHILTNKHVVAEPEGYQRVKKVSLQIYNPGEKPVKITGRVVAESSELDLAVLEMDVPRGLKIRPASFRLDKLIQGLPIVAIGNPAGLENTATYGIISQINVDITKVLPSIPKEYHSPLILTDTAINPGNSGGALGDLCGAVVGMPSFTLTSMPGRPRQNLNFAYSSETLVKYLRDVGLSPTIMKHKKKPPASDPNNVDQLAQRRHGKPQKILFA